MNESAYGLRGIANRVQGGLNGGTVGMTIFVRSRKCYGGKHEDSKSIPNENIYVAH